MAENKPEEPWRMLALKLADKQNADVILYTGAIATKNADELIGVCRDSKRRENVVLMLTTLGGSPHAAFRIARCLQRQYKKFTLYIYGFCKSAGTLVAIGANEIILSDFGECGPLDVQLDKKDELFESVSALNLTQALESLNTRAVELFKQTLIDLRRESKGQISTKMAAEIASNLAIGLYGKIYSQIDPDQIGSLERDLSIASEYGKRLQTKNVKPGTLDKLINVYPSHGFIIDRKEAQELFKEVREPDELERELAESISWLTREPASDAFVYKLSQKLPDSGEKKDEQTEQAGADTGATAEKQGSGPDNETSNQQQVRVATAATPRVVK